MRGSHCPELPVEPETLDPQPYYCPVCGEELEEDSWVYKQRGQVTGCENCQERYHAYAAGLEGRQAG